MLEQKKLSRRALLKGLLAAPVMIPFQTDAQTIYRAITGEWEQNSEIRELVIISESFSISQPSHILEAFGEFYPQFSAVDMVCKELKQKHQLWQVGSQKVAQFGDVNIYGSKKIPNYYRDVTTDSPNWHQEKWLSMVRQSRHLKIWVRNANYNPSALNHGLEGCVFGYVPRRYGMDDLNSKFIKTSNDNYHTVGFGGAFLATQALFHLGSYLLEYVLDKWRKQRVESKEWKDTNVVWQEKTNWYRQFYPSLFYDMASEREKVSYTSKSCSQFGLPGGYNHSTYKKIGGITIEIRWYPSDQKYAWMGESPSKWYHDQYGSPQIFRENRGVDKPLFNLVSYKDSRGGTSGRFFRKELV